MGALADMFLVKFFPVSKKINNFVAPPGESMCIYCDLFTIFIKSVPNLHIDYESLKDFFCMEGRMKIVRKYLILLLGVLTLKILFSKLRRNWSRFPKTDKFWSTGKLDARRKTFIVQAPSNQSEDDTREDMEHTRIYWGRLRR